MAKAVVLSEDAWAEVQNALRRVAALERRVNNIRGYGVTNSRDGVTIRRPIAARSDTDATAMTTVELCAVWLEPDGGSNGSATEDCSITYTMTSQAGIVLGEGCSPQTGRVELTEYVPAPAHSWGIALRVTTGTWILLAAFAEHIKSKRIQVTTTTVWNSTTGQFDVTRRYARTLESEDESTTQTGEFLTCEPPA